MRFGIVAASLLRAGQDKNAPLEHACVEGGHAARKQDLLQQDQRRRAHD